MTIRLPRLLSSLPLLALLAGGCTAIGDPSSYRYDRGCDLNFRVEGFGSPHLGLTFFAQLDRPDVAAASGGTDRLTDGIAMLDGIPMKPFTLHIPGGVRSEFSNLDFFVDNDGTPGYSPIAPGGGRGDHSWTLHDPCAEPLNTFAHIAIFQDFNAVGTGRGLTFDLRGFVVGTHAVEVRSIQIDPYLDAIDGPGDGSYTRGFIHVTTPAAETVIGGGDTRGHLVTKPIPHMLDDVGFTVELWIDRDDDQVVDDTGSPGTDEGYVFVFSDDPLNNPGTLPIPSTSDPAPLVVLDVDNAGTADHSGTVGVFVDP